MYPSHKTFLIQPSPSPTELQKVATNCVSYPITMRFLLAATTLALSAQAFTPSSVAPPVRLQDTSIHAIGALARKAKEATLREYISGGIEDNVMEKYNIIKDALSKEIDTSADFVMGPLQERLTRRKGTITVIAEYKRKLSDSGYIRDVFEPAIMSREFREFGASGIAVMADERMGGCTYEDLAVFVEDQRRSKNEVPGPVQIINNDLIIDELQIAQSAAYGASAVVLSLEITGIEDTTKLLKAAKSVELEVIVAVSSKEQAQEAVDIGARIVSVINVDGADEKTKVIKELNVPEGETVTTIANILHRDNKGLEEVTEAWACRDKGFNCAWISDALYKAGNSEVEHPGAIVKSMTSKSSLKWASPVARSGRGEGAREYLGDIMM
jgi:indole-3-glycerol phosphate synthase